MIATRRSAGSLAALLLVGGLAAGCVRVRDGGSAQPVAADAAKAQIAATPGGTVVATTAAPTPTATVAAAPTNTAAAPSATAAPTTPASTAAAAPATTGTAAPAGTASPTPIGVIVAPGGGEPHNIVRVVNHSDGTLRARGHVRVNRIPGPSAQPANFAEAYGSCTGCSTFAVALQIDLISKSATTIAPQNAAVALNVQCNGCTTVADAYQYVIQVDDPRSDTPDGVRDLVNQMNDEIRAIQQTPNITPQQAESQVEGVIAQFQGLAASLNKQRSETEVPQSPNAPNPPPAEEDD